MVSVVVSSVVGRGLEHQSGQTKDYKINTSCFSAKYSALRGKSEQRLLRVNNMCTHGLLFQ